MELKEFKTVLERINSELKDKDKKKVTSDTFKVSFSLSECTATDLSIKEVSSYTVNLDTDTISVKYRFGYVEEFVRNQYNVSEKDFLEMKKAVFSEHLFRAYFQFLNQTVQANKEKLNLKIAVPVKESKKATA